MVFEAKKIVLKDGREVELRTPGEDDAQLMIDYLVAVTAETPFLNAGEGEISQTVENERAWIRSYREGESLLISCFADGCVVGNLNVNRGKRQKNRHRGTVGIALRKEWWNQGLGSALFREAIAYAERAGLSYLELSLNGTNERAMRLYEKFGFQVIARIPDAFRLPDGSSAEDVMMRRPV